ncbi:MAG TPA: trehalose-6-phosphate synthase [Gemmataceae bacterium]|nr:trehalose-6-phosphate synthase [Gemmataceae bacterium]
MGWTKGRLEEVAQTRLGGAKLIVVANREPYIHRSRDGQIRCIRPASGLTTALDPVMRACGGVWVAHGSGDADKVVSDEKGRIGVPPESPNYVLRRVWLTKEQEEGYYYGFSNSTLWPLCHQAYCRPTFDPDHWEMYRQVNEQFAAAVLEEARGGPALVFVQDYHFALLPRLLKDARPDLVIAQFWHIPWPNPETFRVCPWADHILDGMLGNDLMSFHTQYHCNNFLDTVDRALECRIEAEHFTVTRNGQRTRVRPHPISVDPDLAEGYCGYDWEFRVADLRDRFGLGKRTLLVGVDRLDYTKGIPERLRSVGRLLDKQPALKGRFHFVQVGAPSRTTLPAYRALNEEVATVAAEVNARHAMADWKPVVFLHEHAGPEMIFPLYRAAAGCVVSSLHDGMNLVAKEFVSARKDERGVLVLSEFTGAARELTDAVIVNPYDLDQLADAMHTALTMPAAEQQRRMVRMRHQVADHNIYRWAGMLLSEAGKLVPGWPTGVVEPEPVGGEETLDRLLARSGFTNQAWLAWGP